MRKVIGDFYFTVWLPLAVVATVSLWNSIRLALQAKWRADEGVGAKRFIRISIGTLIALIIFIFLSDEIKLEIAAFFWAILGVGSSVCVLIAGATAYHFSQKRNWPYFALSVAALLMAFASIEHFSHLDKDTKHILCRDCSDSDEDPYDPSF